MDLGLTGKVAVVAGGTSGIGFAIAEELSREGATVALCGRDRTRLDAARASLASRTGGTIDAAVVDIRDNDAATGWIDQVANTHGAVHVLVTNAGGPPAGATDAFDLDDYRDALELSMLSHIGLVQAALPRMRAAGWGRVLVVASETVRQPIPEYALSNVVRPGLVGYVRTLVHELADSQVTVNVLAPGYTATESLLNGLPGEADRDSELRQIASDARIPLGRLADPAEVAAVAAFLASDRAGFVTGTVQVVDGGRAVGI